MDWANLDWATLNPRYLSAAAGSIVGAVLAWLLSEFIGRRQLARTLRRATADSNASWTADSGRRFKYELLERLAKQICELESRVNALEAESGDFDLGEPLTIGEDVLLEILRAGEYAPLYLPPGTVIRIMDAEDPAAVKRAGLRHWTINPPDETADSASDAQTASSRLP